MNIIITQWALDAYLNIRGIVFTKQEFDTLIKPDVMLLRHYPSASKFQNGKFWSIAGHGIKAGFKIKWHQIGNGKVQLRLLVGLIKQDFYLCEAYHKRNEKFEQRQLMKFKTHIALIREGKYNSCGVLT